MSRITVVTAYVTALAVAAALALGLGLARQSWSGIDPATFVLLLLVAGATQRVPVFLFRSSAVSVSFAATIAAYVLYGTGAGLVTQLVCALVNAVTPRKPAVKVIFNTASLVVSGFLAGSAYQLVGGTTPPTDIVRSVLAVAASGAVYFGASTSFTAAVISFSSRTSFLAIWRENYAWMAVNFLATGVNGASLAIAAHALGFFGAATFVLPLAVAWYSFRLYMTRSLDVRKHNDELQDLNQKLRHANESLEQSALSIIEALVSALEAKDEHARGHSAATMSRAVATARRLGLAEEDVTAIRFGALIHDVGKIGIAPEILRKSAPLTDIERDEMRTHPIIGAQLLAHVSALDGARPIVLAHHERYDGTGYPRGLRGMEIPIAAQIVSVADAFDAMTTSRPYRAPLSPADAVRELRAGAGTQFNPAVVEAFIATIGEPSEVAAMHQHAHGHASAAPASAQ